MYIYVHTYVSNTNFKEAGVYMSILDQRNCGLKNIIREIFEKYHIIHSTIQIEKCGESCVEHEHHSHIHKTNTLK